MFPEGLRRRWGSPCEPTGPGRSGPSPGRTRHRAKRTAARVRRSAGARRRAVLALPGACPSTGPDACPTGGRALPGFQHVGFGYRTGPVRTSGLGTARAQRVNASRKALSGPRFARTPDHMSSNDSSPSASYARDASLPVRCPRPALRLLLPAARLDVDVDATVVASGVQQALQCEQRRGLASLARRMEDEIAFVVDQPLDIGQVDPVERRNAVVAFLPRYSICRLAKLPSSGGISPVGCCATGTALGRGRLRPSRLRAIRPAAHRSASCRSRSSSNRP